MTFLIKTDLFAVFDNQNNYTGSVFTDIQMKVLFDGNSEDFYQHENNKYYRVYNENLEESEKKYTKWYTNTPNNYFLNDDKTFAICPLETGDFTTEQLELVFKDNWSKIRIVRNKLLSESDAESFIMLPDVWNEKSEQWKTQWLNYRKKLRDLPENFVNPFEIIWPEKPTI